MGEGLENYIKDVFANTLNEKDSATKLETLSEIFSYQRNKNNPPNLILKKFEAKLHVNSWFIEALLEYNAKILKRKKGNKCQKLQK